MALYGYARVSTAEQDCTLQEHALRAAGCEVLRAEKVSATRREGRTELALLLEFLRRGDTLVVTRVDRLARSIKDLQDIVYLLKERGVREWVGPGFIPRRPAVIVRRKVIPIDSLVQLRQRLDRLPPKSPERAAPIAAMAQLYGVSSTTVYRTLRALLKPRAAHRADRGTPRVLPQAELERYCELIAALQLRTTHKQGRHLSTPRAIEILEQYGVETSQGLLRAPPGVLHKSTINL